MAGERDLDRLLASLEVERRPGRFTFVTGADLADRALAAVAESEGITYVVSVDDAVEAGVAYDFVGAWLTLTVHSSLEAVGLTAAVSAALAKAGIACNVLAGYHHDHLLVPDDRADDAIDAIKAIATRHRPSVDDSTADRSAEPFARKPTIVGARVTLRPIVGGDAESMWRDLGDEEGNRLTGTHATFTRAQIERWAATRSEQPDRLDLAVVDRITGEWYGEAVINDWDPDNGCCGFRIALGAGARDRGLGTEATRLLVDHVFEHHPVHRIELEVYEFNPRARAVYERVGFVEEGRRRGALDWHGTRVDAISMAMLRSDWDSRR